MPLGRLVSQQVALSETRANKAFKSQNDPRHGLARSRQEVIDKGAGGPQAVRPVASCYNEGSVRQSL